LNPGLGLTTSKVRATGSYCCDGVERCTIRRTVQRALSKHSFLKRQLTFVVFVFWASKKMLLTVQLAVKLVR
jgi:hypothetical protein